MDITLYKYLFLCFVDDTLFEIRNETLESSLTFLVLRRMTDAHRPAGSFQIKFPAELISN